MFNKLQQTPVQQTPVQQTPVTQLLMLELQLATLSIEYHTQRQKLLQDAIGGLRRSASTDIGLTHQWSTTPGLTEAATEQWSHSMQFVRTNSLQFVRTNLTDEIAMVLREHHAYDKSSNLCTTTQIVQDLVKKRVRPNLDNRALTKRCYNALSRSSKFVKVGRGEWQLKV